MNRRDILKFAGGTVLNGALVGGGAAALILPANASTLTSTPDARATQARRLSFVNTHTGDTFADAYWENGSYVQDAMTAINHVMRDHRSGETHEIDPRLLDQLHTLRGVVETQTPYQIISGYRSPTTNASR